MVYLFRISKNWEIVHLNLSCNCLTVASNQEITNFLFLVFELDLKFKIQMTTNKFVAVFCRSKTIVWEERKKGYVWNDNLLSFWTCNKMGNPPGVIGGTWLIKNEREWERRGRCMRKGRRVREFECLSSPKGYLRMISSLSLSFSLS